MVYVPPISQAEFLHLLQKCIPPIGWPRRIAVANSGGPDSTCLLFLLSQLVRQRKGQQGLPQSVVSIHVNHNLQDAADDMANKASLLAVRLSVPHVTSTIPWGTPPFPHKPTQKAIEGTARRGRYNRLFDTMTTLQASCIALGHHADDQVETTILRLSRGTGILGASGMPFVRRWGMGGPGQLDFTGQVGMERYIIRPFLEIPKDRILATCHEHELDYVVDKTNFEPDLTLRNQIRKILTSQTNHTPPSDKATEPEPDSVATQSAELHQAIEALGSDALRTEGRTALYDSVGKLREKVEKIGLSVTQILKQNLLPSPPSTAVIPLSALQKIEDIEVRISLARRLIRYVSPHPWGHVGAEMKGRRDAYEALVDTVWSGAKDAPHHLWSFGSHVLWQPVAINSKGLLRFRKPVNPKEEIAWLLTRESPSTTEVLRGKDYGNPLIMDITSTIKFHLKTKRVAKLLYDCRFTFTFYPSRAPKWIRAELENTSRDSRVVLVNYMRFFLPKVVLRREGFDDLILLMPRWDERKPSFNGFEWVGDSRKWIKVTFVRPYAHV